MQSICDLFSISCRFAVTRGIAVRTLTFQLADQLCCQGDQAPMVVRLPPLHSLRAFEAVARLGSLSAAADDLCVTHSAIVHQLKQLQEWMGVQLLVRGPRGLELTEAGKRYRVPVCESFERMAIETQYLRRGQDSALVRVSALPMFGMAWLLPRMQDFWAQHPAVNVSLTYSPPTTREFPGHDLWIGFEADTDVPTRGRAHLMNGATVPVCSPLYLERKGPILRPADLEVQDIIHEESCEPWIHWFRANGLEVELAEGGRTLTDGNMLLASVLAGDGVALIHKALISRHLKSHTLVQLFDSEVEGEFGYFVAWDPGMPLRRSVVTFRDWLIDRANDPVD